MKILLAYGTRPEWIKLAPLVREFEKRGVDYKLLFTGQQKDIGAFEYYWKLEIPNGKNRLDSIIQGTMNFLSDVKKFYGITHVLVQGDTTSGIGIALSAFNNGLKVIHLEAGLRTYDRENPYPEEVNRRIISQIADIHLCPTQQNAQNLYNEHINVKDIYVVGNTVIDSLIEYKKRVEYSNKILVTLHRRENHNQLAEWFKAIDILAEEFSHYEFILPLHPNPNVQKHKDLLKYVKVVDPMSHEELIEFLIKTKLVITDSGGLQEECSYFNKKCLVCRKVTERPEVLSKSSFIVHKPEDLNDLFKLNIYYPEIKYECPYGDGHAAEKITDILEKLKDES